ncbi:cytochrome c oxidase assembly factor 1 homolog isoform X1 [Amphiprion ocellaris]|uniref:Ribosomal protein L37 n=1 Tax=Amphiprion ocellaris TaxID=80972 RepID=A0AAQ5Z978_AMPOC|nr:cytochrome c oxidase assembly factor 1 homolog isoform X1 [Amphiprion ocellaris]
MERTHTRLVTVCVTFTEVNKAESSCQWNTRNKAKMRVSTSQLQQLTIFTTVLTGGGVGTMYYLLQNLLLSYLNSSPCSSSVSEKFAESGYHKLALQKLESCPFAMESLGAPPLKVHNIHLTDRNNRIAQHTAQIKIPVTGSKTGGYLYTSSFRDPDTNSWSLKQAVLKLREGQTIDLLNSSPVASQTQVAENTQGVETGDWHK